MTPKDTIKSKKLWFSVGATLSLVAFALLAAKFPALIPLYDTFTGGVVGITTVYLTGNVANKWVLAGAAAKKTINPEG